MTSEWNSRFVSLATAALLASACGGGGGGGSGTPTPPGRTLRGTAAAGAPLIGTVTVKDAAGRTRGGVIDRDGRYVVDVSGLTAPFMVRADGRVGGKAYSLYSAGVETDLGGTLNVTPLTDLIVANVAHDLAAARFASGDFSAFTPAALAAREAELQAALTPLLGALGVAASVDLLRMSFAADHSGLDAALDLLDVEVDTTTRIATLRNVVNGDTATCTITTGAVTGTLDPGDAVTAITGVQGIAARLAQLTTAYATRVPTAAEIEAIGLFDTAAFRHQGESWDLFVGKLTGDVPPGVSFGNLVVLSGLGQARLQARFDAFDADGSYGGSLEGTFVRDGLGVYRAIGDQRLVHAELETHANDDGGTRYSGYLLELRDPANVFGGNGVGVLSGPGVPGVTFRQTARLPRFTRNVSGDDPTIFLTDAQVAEIPEVGATYRLDLMFAGTTTVTASYDLGVTARPIAPGALTAASFIGVRAFSPAPTALPSFAGGTISGTFTLPPGMSRAGWFFIVFEDASHRVWMDGAIGADGTSGTITVPASEFAGWSGPKRGFCYVGGSDVSGRAFETRVAVF